MFNKQYREETLKRFVKDYSLPIQPCTNELMPYYIDLYNPIFETQKKWQLFEDVLTHFKSEEEFLCYGNELTDTITKQITATPVYNEFNTCNLDNMMPVNQKVRGVTYVKGVNLYIPNNHEQYFISVDLRKANYQALRAFSKGIVLDTDSYDQLIEKFTDLEYFKNSKQIRQVIFGNLNMGRITRQVRFLNEKVLCRILDSGYTAEDILVFTTDEIIIKCKEPKFISKEACETMEQDIYDYTGLNAKVESFKLVNIYNDTYVKEHENELPTFKGGSSIYFPQVYKAYMGIPLEERDLYFMYEKHLAKFEKPLDIVIR